MANDGGRRMEYAPQAYPGISQKSIEDGAMKVPYDDGRPLFDNPPMSTARQLPPGAGADLNTYL